MIAAMEMVAMRERADCVIACLAMLSGQPYRCVWERAGRTVWRQIRDNGGLSVASIRRLARAVWCPLRVYQMPRLPDDLDPEDITGLLCLMPVVPPRRGRVRGHAVVWGRGLILDPASGLIWVDESAFYTHEQWTPSMLFVPEDRKTGGRR